MAKITTITLLTALLLCTIIKTHAREPASSDAEDTIVCVKPGTLASATYNYGPGSQFSATISNIMVGSKWPNSPRGNTYGCMGRCGAGCVGDPKNTGLYTEDCLAHDICSQQQNATGGAADKNCGDEFKAAADDTVKALFVSSKPESYPCEYSIVDGTALHLAAALGNYEQKGDVYNPDNPNNTNTEDDTDDTDNEDNEDGTNNEDDGFLVIPLSKGQAVVIPSV